MTEVVVVLVTTPDIAKAAEIARALVDEKIAACVSILPGITSIFPWEGATKTVTEHQLIIKTTTARLDDLAARVEALHPYKVPELIALPVAAGLQAYLQWIADETTKPA